VRNGNEIHSPERAEQNLALPIRDDFSLESFSAQLNFISAPAQLKIQIQRNSSPAHASEASASSSLQNITTLMLRCVVSNCSISYPLTGLDGVVYTDGKVLPPLLLGANQAVG